MAACVTLNEDCAATCVVSVALHWAAAGHEASPPPLTCVVLVMLVGALAATATLAVTVELVFAAMLDAVQESAELLLPSEHVHPAPLAPENVAPAGSVLVKVIDFPDAVAALPELATMKA